MWKLGQSMDSQDHQFGTEGLKSSTLATRVQNHLYVRSRYTNLPLLLACRTFCKDPSDVRLGRLADGQFYWTVFISLEACLLLNGWPSDELSRLMCSPLQLPSKLHTPHANSHLEAVWANIKTWVKSSPLLFCNTEEQSLPDFRSR
ncbi:unnamed protein product [Larinioides sclopetarius]|uniref:Uncharacterized protein n=1 Tax=Larinioides sclopetarius TaxID=280406 RepID=A0AAV2A0Y8_9ARAC